MMFGYYGAHMDPAGWFTMGFASLAFWIVLGALVTWVLRSVLAARTSPAPSGRAADVLALRFARGEIDAEEYAERLRVLERREP